MDWRRRRRQQWWRRRSRRRKRRHRRQAEAYLALLCYYVRKKVHKSTDPKQSHGNDVTFSIFHPDPNSSETNPKFLQSVNAMSAPIEISLRVLCQRTRVEIDRLLDGCPNKSLSFPYWLHREFFAFGELSHGLKDLSSTETIGDHDNRAVTRGRREDKVLGYLEINIVQVIKGGKATVGGGDQKGNTSSVASELEPSIVV
ncbi:hypothetical protein G4B88_015160 [Cannabis sativa]|uniref:Uncharacterized protein n=1 Tax=Cannabis sativa TaxID=3483 RepID=A0A7J6FY46_CANSA|nr:hypothetical protein G4B88_015160 [Cannabis sativa]